MTVDPREELRVRGYALLPAGSFDPRATLDPWSFVEGLVGERPRMVERQLIRPIPGGRSFASTRGATPLHTDSQDLLGEAPALQVMLCHEPAARGGECLLVDGYALLATVAREDPALHRALHATERAIPFYFGTVRGPTVALRRGAWVLTVSPMPATDPVGAAFAEFVARAPVVELPLRRGEALLVDNHRMLHGRRPFHDDAREFLRLLAWLETPLARAPGPAAEGPRGDHRLRVVLELCTGVPPAKLATREGVAEETLYRWRSRALAAARDALEDD